MNRIFFIASTLALLFISCGEKPTSETNTGLLKSGDYVLTFDMDTLQIPIQFHIGESGDWSIVNWTEHIPLDSIQWKDSTFHVQMPLYNSVLDGKVETATSLSGVWTDLTREPLYQIHFFAQKEDLPALPTGTPDKLIYTIEFSPEVKINSDSAIGLFYKYDTLLYGTIMTRSGDHRFLQGKFLDNTINLSSFNGAHLMHYEANVIGDSIKGRFFSGSHYSVNWEGFRNPDAILSNPDSITRMKNPDEEFRFKVRALNGDSVQFGTQDYLGKVTIVQVLGSWCANCSDESKFFKTLYDEFHDSGLQIIPIAFERSADFDVAKQSVQRQFSQLGLSYPPYFGEKISRGAASRTLTALTDITAYPTSVFIDKKGKVRKVHTGFYGPGTGDYYKIHTTDLHNFVSQLVNE